MNKVLSLVFLGIASIGTMLAWDNAHGHILIDNLYYDLDTASSTARVVSMATIRDWMEGTMSSNYQGMKMANIPSAVTYRDTVYTVTRIQDCAFMRCSSLDSVIIPNTVTWMGNLVFADCDNLEYMEIPSSLTYVGAMSFPSDLTKTIHIHYMGTLAEWCNKPWTVSPNSSITCTPHELYLNDTKLTDVVIPETVTSIAEATFRCCRSITSLTTGDHLDSIGNNAFSACHNLTSIHIGSRLTEIQNEAFSYCDSLVSVTIPDNVTTLGERIFEQCRSLTYIRFPGGLAKIPDGTCSGCTRLTTLILPDTVRIIGRSAFESCALKDFVLPGSVTTIQPYAFSYLLSPSVTIAHGSALDQVGEYAFYGGQLKAIYVPCGELEHFQQVLSDYTKIVRYAEPYNFTLEAQNGYVDRTEALTVCDTITLTAYPSKHYHFAQWSDGNTDNPRTIFLIQDTSLIAECTIDEFLVRFFDFYEELLEEQWVKYGENAVLPEAPDVEHYTFVGWSHTCKNVQHNMNVYAIYERNKEESIENLSLGGFQPTKILRNGQILILRGDKAYTVDGQEVK
jgi:hypothetical protein